MKKQNKKKITAENNSEGTAKHFIERLYTYRSEVELMKHHRYFTFDEKSTTDRFIGVRMGQVFALAKEFSEMPPDEIEKLLESPIHEVRAGAVSIMDKQSRGKKTTEQRKKELFDLYIRRHDRINNWDLVDLGCLYMIGNYLLDKPRKILYKLAESKNMWERRTAIVGTAYLIRKKHVDDVFTIAEMLMHEKEDQVSKGTGWMLRFAGDVDRHRLLHFLDTYAAIMPRVALRNAIEHLDKKQREHYLHFKDKT